MTRALCLHVFASSVVLPALNRREDTKSCWLCRHRAQQFVVSAQMRGALPVPAHPPSRHLTLLLRRPASRCIPPELSVLSTILDVPRMCVGGVSCWVSLGLASLLLTTQSDAQPHILLCQKRPRGACVGVLALAVSKSALLGCIHLFTTVMTRVCSVI